MCNHVLRNESSRMILLKPSCHKAEVVTMEEVLHHIFPPPPQDLVVKVCPTRVKWAEVHRHDPRCVEVQGLAVPEDELRVILAQLEFGSEAGGVIGPVRETL